jgi:hypothetical protein
MLPSNLGTLRFVGPDEQAPELPGHSYGYGVRTAGCVGCGTVRYDAVRYGNGKQECGRARGCDNRASCVLTRINVDLTRLMLRTYAYHGGWVAQGEEK